MESTQLILLGSILVFIVLFVVPHSFTAKNVTVLKNAIKDIYNDNKDEKDNNKYNVNNEVKNRDVKNKSIETRDIKNDEIKVRDIKGIKDKIKVRNIKSDEDSKGCDKINKSNKDKNKGNKDKNKHKNKHNKNNNNDTEYYRRLHFATALVGHKILPISTCTLAGQSYICGGKRLCSSHAEINAIKSIPYYKLKDPNFCRRIIIYVVRFNACDAKHNVWTLTESRPCFDCLLNMKILGINKIIYSTGAGILVSSTVNYLLSSESYTVSTGSLLEKGV